MKRIHFLMIICIILCGLFAFTLIGCDDNALPRPQNLRFEETTLTLSWSEIDNARYYIVNINGAGTNTDKNTRKNSLSLSNMRLEEGDYQLKVKACGDGKEFSDSKWSNTVTFSQDKDTGLTFKFISGNNEVEVTGLGRAEGDVVIPDTYRGKPVTKIGDYAFAGKSKLTGVTMGNNVKTIGTNAFYNCTMLKSVSFTDSVEVIGEKAFQSCRTLAGKLVIPDNVTAIGANAFAYCGELTEIEFNDGLESIGANAFAECTKIKSLIFTDGVKYIGDSAFFRCTGLTSIKFGTGLESIDNYAFADCDGLESVSFNMGLRVIGAYAFEMCDKLKTVELSDTVQIIGTSAFYKCPLLESVSAGSGLKRIRENAFNETSIWKKSADEVYLNGWFLGCKNKDITQINIKNGTVGIADLALSEFEKITQVILPDSVKVIGDGAFALSKIATAVIGGGVEEIGTQAFYKCEMLSNVILGSYDFVLGQMKESSLKTIANNAFMGCTQLASIEIPNTVEFIDSYAFKDSALYKNATDGVAYAGNWVVGCDNTRARGSIVIEDGTVGIANYAFYKCTNITDVQIPDSVKTIGRAAFYNCTSLISVELPAGLETIEDYTFYNCTSLRTPVLPNTLKSIGRSAFYKCALANADGDTDHDVLIIPDSVETIGDFAFFNCGYTTMDFAAGVVYKNGIDEIRLGNGLKHIGANAFNSIETLKKVVFGANVEALGAKAFYNCSVLTEVVFNDSLQSIGARAFYGCNQLLSVKLPAGLVSLDNYAFYRCTAIKEVVFGANVQTIGDYAFFGCTSIKSLYLPASVNSIGKQAFRGCAGLESITIPSEVKNIAIHAFYGCSSLTIYAQDGGPQDGWDERFNSGYRPVVWGCTLTDGYVSSFTKMAGSISNVNTVNAITAPQREGYTFAGWATSSDTDEIAYTAAQLKDVPNGTTLYAVWQVAEDDASEND